MKKKVIIPIVVCIILLAVSIAGNLSFWTSLNQANSEIISLENTVYTKSSEIEILEGIINTKESEIETLESQRNSLEADKDNLQSQISSLETDKSQLESQVSSLQTDKSSLQTEVTSLETENNQLQTWLDGNITNYESQLTAKDAQILDLENENKFLEDENDELWLTIWSLRSQYDTLNTTHTWLKQHSFTYYTVGDAINISNVGIFNGHYWTCTINGTITNISDKPIETVYVYLILRNPDGTAVFDTWDYDIIENLYIDETSPFEFSTVWDYDESQTVEIFLVY
ncbi:hypothetical protein ES707_03827 [subsurface metagenome]